MAGKLLGRDLSSESSGGTAGTATTEGEGVFTSSTGAINRYPPLGIVWIKRGFFLSSSKTFRSSEIDRVRTSSVTNVSAHTVCISFSWETTSGDFARHQYLHHLRLQVNHPAVVAQTV